MAVTLATEEWCARAVATHGDRYDYSLVPLKPSWTRVVAQHIDIHGGNEGLSTHLAHRELMSTTTVSSHATLDAPIAANETTPEYRFTAADRCDTCGAQAYIGAVVNDSELLYCAHHARKYEAKLRLVASAWHDESRKLHEVR